MVGDESAWLSVCLMRSEIGVSSGIALGRTVGTFAALIMSSDRRLYISVVIGFIPSLSQCVLHSLLKSRLSATRRETCELCDGILHGQFGIEILTIRDLRGLNR